MSRRTMIFTGLLFAALSLATKVQRADNSYATTCTEIARSVSSDSKVYYYGSSQYTKDNEHWASSSSQVSACSFEPASAEDVGVALHILANDQTPFAVKSGGHTANPGFSSTPGVQIALYSFSGVTYNSSAQTATIGMGLIWDDVYTELEQYGVSVVGPKSTGVGIGGVVLGGGYSYLSNEYGLSLDNVVAFELVMPNGTIASITSSSDPDLFFGLRGGFNNFGIVTTVTLKAHPMSQVWGGSISYAEAQWDEVNTAIANFVANVSDPKASLHVTGDYVSGVAVLSNMLFYDAPEYPADIFGDFLAIEHFSEDLSIRTYPDMIQTLPSNGTTGLRSVFYWVVIEQFTPSILEMVKNQTLFYGPELTKYSASFISYDIIPYLPSLYNHSDTPSAFPSSRDPGQGHSFIEVYCGWTDPNEDDMIKQLGAESAAYMKQFVVDAGQDVANALIYPNGAPSDTPLEDMYGDALARLQSIRSAVDPDDVMSLTGGWRF